MTSARTILAGVVVIFAIPGTHGMAQDDRWWIPVKQWTAPAPGEHPRILFHRSDLPALKTKAKTPEGRKILARLRELLGNDGEKMPDQYNPGPSKNVISDQERAAMPVGSFTVTHGAGYGLLYQLTGKKHYADMARQCVEKVLAGQCDRDRRYCFTQPGTGFRLGLVLQGVALAYDLCYDAWEPAFRGQVVKTVLEMKPTSLAGNKGKLLTLEFQAAGGKYPPGSNHFGAFLGGAGVFCLAVRGDPGADAGKVEKVLQLVEKSIVTLCTRGFGDHGWFAEGTSTGRIASNTGLTPLLGALKNAGGRDYISPRPNARYAALRYISEVVRMDGKPQVPHRGVYGHDEI
jgi:hypothetical protein